MLIYDRASAVAYAKKYGLRPNRYFHNYGGEGGDCTSFVSQAMWAGGFPMFMGPSWGAPGWASRQAEDAYDTPGHWYNGWSTPAWAAAENFKYFLKRSGRGWISDRFSMTIGDIAQIVDIDGTVEGSGAEHTMLITKTAAPSPSGGVGGANLWFTYHSRNAVDTPLAYVESTLKPNQQLIFWKVNEVIWLPSELGQTPYGSDYTP